MRKKVAIIDLRDNPSWNYDWLLVTKSYEALPSIHEIAYLDKHDNYVLFDGTPEEAYEFYSKYCRKHNLKLIKYDKMMQKDLRKKNN